MEVLRTVRIAGQLNRVNEFSYRENEQIGEFLVRHKRENYFIVSNSGVLEDNETCSLFNNVDGLLFKMRCLYYKLNPNYEKGIRKKPFSLEQRSLTSILDFPQFVAFHQNGEVDVLKNMTSSELFSFDEANPLIIFDFPCYFSLEVKVGPRNYQVETIITDQYLNSLSPKYLLEKIWEAFVESIGCSTDGIQNYFAKYPPNVKNLVDLSTYKFDLSLPRSIRLPVVVNPKKTVDIRIIIEDDDLLENPFNINIEKVSAKLEIALRKEFGENIDIRKVKESLPADLFMLLSHSVEFSQISFILVEQIDPILRTNEIKSARIHYLEVAEKYNKDPANRHPCITEFDALCQKLQKDSLKYLRHLYSTQDLFGRSVSLPYISIVGPDGIGKTQFCYILQAIFPYRFVRLLLNIVQYTCAQPINKDNSWLSLMFSYLCGVEAALFGKIFTGELAELAQSCRAFAHCSVCDKPLKSIGFVVSLLSIVAKSKYAVEYLKYPSAGDIPDLEDLTEFRYREMSFREAILHLSQFDKPIPIVLLDEFIVENHIVRPIFMRNLLRALGILCATVGTDPKASILVDQYLPCQSEMIVEEAEVWVYVWNRLPEMTFKTFTRSEELLQLKRDFQDKQEWAKIFDWFETIPSHNCRMITYAAEEVIKYCRQYGRLEKPFPFHVFFGYLVNTVRIRLDSIRQLYDPQLQVYAIIGNIASNFIEWREDSSFTAREHVLALNLTHSHYALLGFPPHKNGNSCFFAVERRILNDRIILKPKGSRFEWKQCSVYPEVKNNELFYLVFEAAQDPEGPRYFSYGTSISVCCKYLEEIRLNNSPSTSNIKTANFKQLGYWTFMTASRLGSLSGTYLQHFLGNLMKQFDPVDDRDIKIKDNPFMKQISARIPYLGPMDSTFSEAFNALEGISVRYLGSAKNGEGIDARIVRKLPEIFIVFLSVIFGLIVLPKLNSLKLF